MRAPSKGSRRQQKCIDVYCVPRAQGAKPSISGLVVKPGSAVHKAHAPAPKHEKDKGDFLLKMGLVSRGGVVRVWVPDPPSKGAKATAASEAATASSAAASRPGGKFVVLYVMKYHCNFHPGPPTVGPCVCVCVCVCVYVCVFTC